MQFSESLSNGFFRMVFQKQFLERIVLLFISKVSLSPNFLILFVDLFILPKQCVVLCI